MQVCDCDGETPLRRHVFLFPGQGTQAVGMGAEVCDTSPATRAVWDCASDISGMDVRKLCLKGPLSQLDKTCFQQLAVTTVSVAMFEALKEVHAIEDCAFAGHSAGEYAALYAAGVFDLEALFQAISTRANIMQTLAERRKGAMYVVKDISHSELQDVIANWDGTVTVGIANDNSPRQQVLSGEATELRNLACTLQRAGFALVKLPVNGAWHSSLMAEGVEPLRQALAALPMRSPGHDVYMNLTAAPATSPGEIVDLLARHLICTVRWRETMAALVQTGYTLFTELGSRKVLGHLLLGQLPAGHTARITQFSDWRRTPALAV